MKNLQNELGILDRLQAPTPSLFGKIRNGAVILATLAAAILSLQAKGIILPDTLVTITSVIVTITGVVTGIISQLTVDYHEYEIKDALKSFD